jgi:hypothetical protein
VSTTEQMSPTIRPVTVDLYRDIHKGIRGRLFELTLEAGRINPNDRSARSSLHAQVEDLAEVLASHAHHEDTHIQPAMEMHLPTLAEQIAGQHDGLERRVERFRERAEAVVDADARSQRQQIHELYLELGSFTSAYLAHQDLEERVVMPDLESTIGEEATGAIHQAIIASIPPDEMGRSLSFMLPAMNVDDRAGLLGGMQAGAPAEVFEGVWGLAGSVLPPADHAALAARLGLAT